MGKLFTDETAREIVDVLTYKFTDGIEAVKNQGEITKTEVSEALVVKSEELKNELSSKCEEVIGTIPDDYTSLSDKVNELSSEIDNLNDNLKDRIYFITEDTQKLVVDNYFDISNYTKGFLLVTNSGEEVLDTRDGYAHDERYYPVIPNETIRSYRFDGSSGFHFSVVYYDENKNNLGEEFGKWRPVATSLVPNNARFARFSMEEVSVQENRKPMLCYDKSYPGYKPYGYHYDIINGSEKKFVDEEDFKESVKSLEKKIKESTQDGESQHTFMPFITKGSVSNGHPLDLDVPNIKWEKSISFIGHFSEFDTLTISHGKDVKYRSGFVTIDNTNVTVYELTDIVLETFAHGLSISNMISVTINVHQNRNTVDLIIQTVTGRFVKTIKFNGSIKHVLAESTTNMNDCVLSFYTSAWNKDIWAFGDSYFDYWTEKACSLGYGNALFDGFSGRNSVQAFQSLEKSMTLGKPKTILWCLGMNDGDIQTEVNTSWKSTYDALDILCKEKNIELVLVTIPNTPTVNNRLKNDIIRNSGHRYVDICKAVGAENNVNWYSGMLGSDQIHPATNGTWTIIQAFMTEIPELRNKD